AAAVVNRWAGPRPALDPPESAGEAGPRHRVVRLHGERATVVIGGVPPLPFRVPNASEDEERVEEFGNDPAGRPECCFRLVDASLGAERPGQTLPGVPVGRVLAGHALVEGQGLGPAPFPLEPG